MLGNGDCDPVSGSSGPLGEDEDVNVIGTRPACLSVALRLPGRRMAGAVV